jgi:hypothetical protein
MHSDFSAIAKLEREGIAVPATPLETIFSRSRALRSRDRLRMVLTCGALIGAIGAGTVAPKLYDGIQFWMHGDRWAVIVNSMAIMSPPSATDLRTVTASATFPVVYPVGLPAGTHLIRAIYAPADHPTSITLQYLNPRSGLQSDFTLVDPRAVNATAFPAAGDRRPHFAELRQRQWRVGSETVIAFQGNARPSYAQAIERAMLAATPSESLSATENTLWRLRVLGGTYELANAADRIAPESGGVLIDRGNLRLIPKLARANRPLLAARTTYLTHIPYVNGQPQYNRASLSWEHTVAIPADGIRAVAAVMAAADESGRWTDCCEILYAPSQDGSYTLWTLPVSGSVPVKKYLVNAETYRVTSLGTQAIAH